MSAPMASTARGVTRVLLLADAPVLRRGLVSMINETAGMQSVGTPGELRRALTLVESARPDAVVVELGSGRAATLNACRDLRRRFPRVAIVALATLRGPGRGQRGARRRRPRLPHDQHVADPAGLGHPGRPRRPHRRRPADPPGRALGHAGREALHAGGAR